MKRYIILLIILIMIPINVSAFEKATDTTHESYLLPYYTNLFNDYNFSNYTKALEIINNSPNSNANYKFDYILVKNYNGTIIIIQVSHNQSYLKLTYNKSSSYYSFSINQNNTSVPSTAVYFYTMTVTSSTTATTFSGSSSNGFMFFSSYNGYSTSGWSGTNFINNYEILYSTIDIKLEGNNIYNDNMLRKIITYGIPYKSSDISSLDTTGKQEYYKNMTFQNYGKSTTTVLKSGDTFYTHDLDGTSYTFSSDNYKNVTVDIISTSISIGTTFKLQFKTDNYLANPPILYGVENGNYTFIAYMQYDYGKFFTSSYIYEIGNNQLCINSICRLIGDFSSYQIRYKLDNTEQSVTLIYDGSRSIISSTDLDGFEYIAPDEDGNFPSGGGSHGGGSASFDDLVTNNTWFKRTEEYFKSLGDMEWHEYLNPLYWLKGLGMILVDLLVPTSTNNSFQEVYDAIYEKFPIINDLKNTIEQVFDENLINTPTRAPKITINLEPLGIGLGTYILIDFAMFDNFISYIRIFIVSFMLLELIFWYYKKIGAIFQ